MKKWTSPIIETITNDELADMIIASGCSEYWDECERGY